MILLFATIANFSLAAGGTLPGTGTETDPYLIEDVNDFDAFAADPNYWAAGVHTKLMANIDLAGRTYTTAVIAPDTDNSNGSWNFDGAAFSGIFNGNDYTVINLKIITSSDDYLGLFGYSETGTTEIKNLRVLFCNIICEDDLDFISILVGHNSATITDCYVGGTIVVADYCSYIGGLCGFNNDSSINNCYSSCTIKAGNLSGKIGGLCGNNFSGTISNCSSEGSVGGFHFLGGLVGNNHGESLIINSYSTCSVDATGDFVGGLVGNNESTVTNCYSNGSVNGTEAIGIVSGSVGGLVGDNHGSITNCYTTGEVSGVGDILVGGLVGSNYDSLIQCFWDIQTSGQNSGIGSGDATGITGLNTNDMMTQFSFTGWDFSTPVWMMLREGEDYPRLAWQEVFDGDIAGLYGVDMVDFARLANYWQLSGCDSGTDCGRADVDESGTVDLPDLAAIATDWLK